MRYTPETINFLEENQIFVFGSNRAGFHGAGAALFAKKVFGAEQGVGEGLTGQCYALPTKDENIKTLPLHEIGQHFCKFFHVVLANPDSDFLLTKVGCGLAGFSVETVACEFWNSMAWIGLTSVPKNLWVPKGFVKWKAEEEFFAK